MRNVHGFTVVEMIVVVVIMGAIAGFAIPNYMASLERAHIQDATLQLKALHAAEQIYYARIGTYWPTASGTFDVAAINSNLNMNIIEEGMTYGCTTGSNTASFICQATRDGGAYTLTVDESPLSGSNPSCSGCP